MYKPTYQALTKGRVSIPNQIYHVRICTYRRRPFFKDFYIAHAFVLAIQRHSELCETLCYVVMPDHIHWLIQLNNSETNLSQIVRLVKRSTTHIFKQNASGKLWQKGFYDRAIRREQDVAAVARYIVRNPVRAGLVKSVRDYSHWDAVFF
jgi:putative transposase